MCQPAIYLLLHLLVEKVVVAAGLFVEGRGGGRAKRGGVVRWVSREGNWEWDERWNRKMGENSSPDD